MYTARCAANSRLTPSLLLIAAACFLSGLSPATVAADTVAVEVDGMTFTLPAGFTIEKVAGPPLVDRPVTAAFDERGRLYVAESSGATAPMQQQLEERPHRILRLEDTTGDGRFDSSTLFADRMMFPEGTLWHDGSLYVAAPPTIWKLTDTTGDGTADRREEWLVTTLTGCANDLHGPYLGRDGYLYWTKGAFAEQSHPQADGSLLTTQAAHVFRRHPSGGVVEPVMTGGMDNPVDVAFTKGGERLVTSTFLEHPGDGTRDGIIHAVYGGVWGKDHAVIEGHARTGELMPIMTQVGAAVPAHMAHYDADAFGAEYTGNLFVAMFNAAKVTRHVLSPEGATFASHDENFLVADASHFFPTDVIEDADGSLLVIETGGWYDICCPAAEHRPDVPGAIYRIRRDDMPGVQDPRGLELAWDEADAAELVERLDDDRPAVRARAIETLGRRGDAAVTPLRSAVEADAAVRAATNSVWTLARIESEGARDAVRAALDHESDTVRQAALHVVALHRDAEAADAAAALLVSPEEPAPVRRVAAEALGRVGDARVVPALVQAAAGVDNDRVLEHSITYALIELVESGAGTARATRQRGGDAPEHLAEAERARFHAGRLHYGSCMACHGPQGQGAEGWGPALADSDWAQAEPEALVRLVLHGFEGGAAERGDDVPIPMPAHAFLADEDLAAILTYIRQSWGNDAGAIDAATVGRVREETAERQAPWTPQELRSLEKE